MKIRISLVHYLNAAPLGWSFLHGPLKEEFHIIPSSPASCADQLAHKEVEIGLIPSIEYQRIPNLQVIPGIAIASVRQVRSVLMVRHHGVEKIKTVALDTSSRTGGTLIKILLHRKMGIQPEFIHHPPDLPEMLKHCDAALLIGDAALKVSLDEYETVDLAEAWIEWQQQPFVFAFWACRSDATLPGDLAAIFQEAKKWGVSSRHEIASAYAKSLDLPVTFLEDYLLRNIDYEMGGQHIEGLKRFYYFSRQENLIPELRPLQFVPG